MSYWQPGAITSINIGTSPNDGTGDDIRTSFTKTDANFSNISQFLSGTSVDFLGANIAFNLNAQYGNITNFFTPNATGTIASFTSNITGGNLISNTGLYSQGTSSFVGNTFAANVCITGNTNLTGSNIWIAPSAGNINIKGHTTPTANISYDLGSPTNYFRNIYALGTISVNQSTLSVAATLQNIPTQPNIGSTSDIGTLTQSNFAGISTTYAFYGQQYATKNLIYYQTAVSPGIGTGTLSGGVYGNVQFGSLLLSNTTASTSQTNGALIVAGGVGVGGNVNATWYNGNVNASYANIGTVTGNLSATGTIFSSGYQVITTNTPGINVYSGISAFSSPVSIVSTNPSTSTSTGALVLSYGGAGIAGNAYVGGNVVAGALVGPYYGTIQTAAQPNITAVGSLGNLVVTNSLNAGFIQATSLGITNITATGNVNVSTINGLIGLQVTGNTTSTGFVGNFYGAVQTAAQPNITSTGALTVPSLNTSGNVVAGALVSATSLTGTLTTASQPNITTVGTLGSLSVTANTTVGNLIASAGGIYSNNYKYANGAPFLSVTIANTSEITANLSSGQNTGLSLVATGVTAGTYGSGTSVPTIQVDAKGRILGITSNAVSSSLGLTGTTGTGTVSLLSGSLTFASANGVTATASGSTITINTPQDLRTTASPTHAGLTVPSITHSGTSGTGDIGASGAAFGTVWATATTAQYADLAEIYTTDNEYEPGTVVVFGGSQEITTTARFADARVAGAISTNPAYLMNSSETGLPVALRGRIPVKVIGPVSKGDSLVTSDTPGFAVSVGTDTTYGQAVFAKAIETDTKDGEKVITAVIL
jgi:hypothetical protein